MSQEIVRAAQKQRAALLEDLQKVEQVLKLYGASFASANAAAKQASAAIKGDGHAVARIAPRAGTKREMIERLALVSVNKRGYASNDDIMADLQEAGIYVTKPSLSAYLSRAPQITYNHGQGWVLKENRQDNGDDRNTATGAHDSHRR